MQKLVFDVMGDGVTLADSGYDVNFDRQQVGSKPMPFPSDLDLADARSTR